MRVFVQVACELDPELNLRVDRRTGEVRPEEGDRMYRVWPLGRGGIAAALSLPEARVCAFALGDEHDDALRQARAAGAERLCRMTFDAERLPVRALSDWLAEREADLVIMDRMAGGVACRLGWSHLAGLSHLRLQDNRLWAFQNMERGNRYEVSTELPAVVRLHPDNLLLPYVSRTRILAVEAPCWEECELPAPPEEQSGVEVGNLQPARARTRGAKTSRTGSKASDRVKALMGLCAPSSSPSDKGREKEDGPQTPEAMAKEFVRYLKHHELIDKERPSVPVS